MEVYGDGEKVTKIVISDNRVTFSPGHLTEAQFFASVLKKASSVYTQRSLSGNFLPDDLRSFDAMLPNLTLHTGLPRVTARRVFPGAARSEAQARQRLLTQAEICSEVAMTVEHQRARVVEGPAAAVVYETYVSLGERALDDTLLPGTEEERAGLRSLVVDRFRSSITHLPSDVGSTDTLLPGIASGDADANIQGVRESVGAVRDDLVELGAMAREAKERVGETERSMAEKLAASNAPEIAALQENLLIAAAHLQRFQVVAYKAELALGDYLAS